MTIIRSSLAFFSPELRVLIMDWWSIEYHCELYKLLEDLVVVKGRDKIETLEMGRGEGHHVENVYDALYRTGSTSTMSAHRFLLVSPATRGLSLAITRHLLRTTELPVYATHRSDNPENVKETILSPLKDVHHDRLRLLKLDLTSEKTIASAADALSDQLPDKSYIHTAFLTGGILHPEKQPSDLEETYIASTFQINVISHLLLIKHFSRFLPPALPKERLDTPAKWVHVSARVGSIEDNKRGGWYSYRASKAALNQVIKTFDLQLEMNKNQAMCFGIHPGTVKTDLSKRFWDSTDVKDKAFQPEEAAEKVVGVIEQLKMEQRGRVWDWAGKLVQ